MHNTFPDTLPTDDELDLAKSFLKNEFVVFNIFVGSNVFITDRRVVIYLGLNISYKVNI